MGKRVRQIDKVDKTLFVTGTIKTITSDNFVFVMDNFVKNPKSPASPKQEEIIDKKNYRTLVEAQPQIEKALPLCKGYKYWVEFHMGPEEDDNYYYKCMAISDNQVKWAGTTYPVVEGLRVLYCYENNRLGCVIYFADFHHLTFKHRKLVQPTEPTFEEAYEAWRSELQADSDDEGEEEAGEADKARV